MSEEGDRSSENDEGEREVEEEEQRSKLGSKG